MALMLAGPMMGQEQQLTAEQVLAEMDSPTFVPTVKVGKVLHEGDSIQYMEMNNATDLQEQETGAGLPETGV